MNDPATSVLNNARGESIIPFHIFAQLSPDAVAKSLLPAKPHLSRRQRRIARGTIKR